MVGRYHFLAIPANSKSLTLFLNMAEAPWEQKMSDSPNIQNSTSEAAETSLILVVDDVSVNRAILANYLRTHNYRVAEACDGRDALEKIDLLRPDLVLLDIQMPIMDGIAVVRELRKDVRFRTIPVIAVTALATQADREAALEAGFDSYLTKPVACKAVLALVVKFLHREATKEHGVARNGVAE